tara:strand:- start:13296 stop:14246 length:951 start_codon:yes stop_codon:yes gene_type:complete
MPCKATAPINVPTAVNQECTAKCNLEYNFGLSSCSIITKEHYLDIMCFDGNNTIKSDMASGSLIVTKTHLYAPSLNYFDGSKADAELIICLNGGGKTLLLCIPVKSSEKASASAKWFSKIIAFAPTRKNAGKKVGVRVNNFTLNDVIPEAPYIIYEGGTFSSDKPVELPCAKDNVMIIFNKDSAINMSSREYSDLRKKIRPITVVPSTIENPLQFNATGTTRGPGKNSGKGKTMTCKPITYPDGSPITDDSQGRLKWISDGGIEDDGKAKDYFWKNLIIILIVFAAIIVVAGLGMLLHKLFSRNGWLRRADATGGG